MVEGMSIVDDALARECTRACVRDDHIQIRTMLEDGRIGVHVQFNYKAARGISLLGIACMHGAMNIISLLMERGASVKTSNIGPEFVEFSILAMAAMRGHPDACVKLCESGQTDSKMRLHAIKGARARGKPEHFRCIRVIEDYAASLPAGELTSNVVDALAANASSNAAAATAIASSSSSDAALPAAAASSAEAAAVADAAPPLPLPSLICPSDDLDLRLKGADALVEREMPLNSADAAREEMFEAALADARREPLPRLVMAPPPSAPPAAAAAAASSSSDATAPPAAASPSSDVAAAPAATASSFSHTAAPPLQWAARRGDADAARRSLPSDWSCKYNRASIESLWEAMADAEARGYLECVLIMRDHVVKYQTEARTPLNLPYAIATAVVRNLSHTWRSWLDAGGHVDGQLTSIGSTLLACKSQPDIERKAFSCCLPCREQDLV